MTRSAKYLIGLSECVYVRFLVVGGIQLYFCNASSSDMPCCLDVTDLSIFKDKGMPKQKEPNNLFKTYSSSDKNCTSSPSLSRSSAHFIWRRFQGFPGRQRTQGKSHQRVCERASQHCRRSCLVSVLKVVLEWVLGCPLVPIDGKSGMEGVTH